jgi:hypothetical protein
MELNSEGPGAPAPGTRTRRHIVAGQASGSYLLSPAVKAVQGPDFMSLRIGLR